MTEDPINLNGPPIMYFLTREAALAAMRGRAPMGELPPDEHMEYLGKDDVGSAMVVTHCNGENAVAMRGGWYLMC